jgi:hypothetical protein
MLASAENDSQTGRGQRAPKRATLKNSLFSVMIPGSASGLAVGSQAVVQ